MIAAKLPLLRPLVGQTLRTPATAKCITSRFHFSTKRLLFNASTEKTTTSQPPPPPSPPPKRANSKFVTGVVTLAILGAGYKWYNGNCHKHNNDFITIHEDLKPYTVKLSTEDTPFQTNYTLVGSGTRTLTISTFKVYGMGIYMADEDFPLVSKIIDSNYLSKTFIDINDGQYKDLSHKEKVKLALNDPVKSEIIINSLLDGGVRFFFKMTPIIKSNLTFVRDGGIVK